MLALGNATAGLAALKADLTRKTGKSLGSMI
jgi:hypothetical protein